MRSHRYENARRYIVLDDCGYLSSAGKAATYKVVELPTDNMIPGSAQVSPNQFSLTSLRTLSR